MGDLKRGAEKAVNWVGDKVGNVWHSFEEGSKQIGEALGFEKTGLTPKSDSTKRKIAASRPQIVPMPDEDELRRAQRRRLAGQVVSGRASTVLTQQDDTLG